MTTPEPEQGVDIAVYITALVKHLGSTDVPLSVFEGLDQETDLLAIELDPEKKIVTFSIIDPEDAPIE